MPDCVKIFAEDGTLLYINPQGLKLLQADSLEELMAAGSVVPPEYLDACISVHNRAMAGETVSWGYEMVGLKGRRIHVEATAVPFRSPDGVMAHLCISRDVTSRLAAQERIRRSEERLRLVQEATGLADFEATFDGRIHCSQRFVAQAGLLPGTETLTNEEWENIVHPDDLAGMQETILQALETSESCEMEYRIVRPDNGDVRWISSRTAIERDRTGTPIRSIGSISTSPTASAPTRPCARAKNASASPPKRPGSACGTTTYATGRREWSGRLLEILGLDPSVQPSLEVAAERVHREDRAKFLELLYDMRDGTGPNRFAYTFRVFARERPRRTLGVDERLADRPLARPQPRDPDRARRNRGKDRRGPYPLERNP